LIDWHLDVLERVGQVGVEAAELGEENGIAAIDGPDLGPMLKFLKYRRQKICRKYWRFLIKLCDFLQHCFLRNMPIL
jgi:hypothetical protein